MNWRIENLLNDTITVGRLKELLEDFEDDQPLLLSVGYFKTMQALPVPHPEEMDCCQHLYVSPYSKSEVAIADYEDGEEPDEELVPTPVILEVR